MADPPPPERVAAGPVRLAESAAELPIQAGERSAGVSKASSAPEGSFKDLPPAGGVDPLDPTVLSYKQGDSSPEREITTERSAVSETWSNEDGSFTTKFFSEPKYFQGEDATWEEIDTALVEDSEPGWVRSAANEWTARFGPIGPSHSNGGVEVMLADGQVLRQAPLGLERDVPPIVEGSTVTYPNAWDGIDVIYTVTSASVKEDLVVRERTTRSEFEFAVEGVEFTSEGAPPGALLARGDAASKVAIAPAEVLDRKGRSADAAARPGQVSRATSEGSVVSVSVDPVWMGGLEDSDLPVTIDPTLVIGSYPFWDFASNGWNGTWSGPRVGNSQGAGDVYWRSMAYFDYTSLLGGNKDVLHASLGAWVNSGTTAAYGVGVQGSTCTSGYSCLQPGWHDVQNVDSFGGFDVTGLYDTWVASNVHNGHLWFGAAEVPGLYNYKSLTLELYIVWNTLPDMAVATGPADGQVVTTTQPTLSVSPISDPDGDPNLYYAFRIASGTDGESGLVANSGWQQSPTWTVPAGVLRDGVSYTWRVFTYDTHSIRNPTWVRKLKVDQRLGSGGPSPMDAAGPVAVNLATGNVTASLSTPTVGTLGGGIGASFTYNSQVARESGLSAEYYVDWNANQAFDGGELWNTRLDPQVSFNWGSDAPITGMGADNYLVRWTGYITVPTGNYTLGTRSDDGARIYLDGGNLWHTDWNNQGMSPTPEWAGWSVAFQAGVPRAIQVEYYENAGGSGMELWVKPPSGDAFIVPSSWLSTTVPGLPEGWTMSAGIDGGSSYVAARVSDTSVVLVGGDASTYEYRRTTNTSGTGFEPPAGSDDTLAASSDGGYVLQADDGYTYTFRSDGTLQSVTSALDDRQPAAVTYTYTGGPPRLSSITDPVSGRSVTFTYGGSNCPTPPPLASPAPSTMLCKIDFSAFDPSNGGPDTSLLVYDSAGRFVRLVNLHGSTTDLTYDGSGKLAKVTDSLAMDAATSGHRANDDNIRTLITYTGAKATGVTLPAPTAGAPRPARTYEYVSATETRVHAAGHTEIAPNLWHRKVTMDSAFRTLTDVDATGATSQTQWDAPDRPLRTVDPAGRVTTTVYDAADRVTDTYGPAPAGCFAGQVPNGTCTTPPVPQTHTDYDQGIQGLAATYWNNRNLSGAPVGHGTQLADNAERNWDAAKPDPSVTSTEWSVRYTGELTLPTVGNYTFADWAASGIRIWLDDRLIIDMWSDPSAWTHSTGPDIVINNPVAGSKHRIRIDVFDTNNSAAFQFWMIPPGGGWQYLPGTMLSPRYGLATTTTTADNSGVPAEVTTTAYANPHLGLATTTAVDPTGLALTSTTSYEAPGSGFLRRTARALPSGVASANTYTYYGATETADDPCTTGTVEAHPQGGMLKSSTAADPDGAGSAVAIVREQRYDAAGRVVASRIGSDPWTCTTFDSRGRVVSVIHPAFGGAPVRTVTTNYTAGGNPFVTSTSDAAGTVTATVDLLGRIVSYTDVWGKTTSSTYDQVGRVTQTIGPAGTLAYTYDAAGRVETMNLDGLLVADPVYDTSRELASVSYPSGTGNIGNGTRLSTLAKDTAGRPTNLTWTLAGGVNVTDVLTRSQSGKIVDQTIDGVDAYPAGPNFVYDTAGRLTTARVPGTTYQYGFAGTGGCGLATAAGKNTNRTSLTVNGGTPVTYCYDHADRLTATTASGYTGAISYDPHGNTTLIAGETRSYDAADRHRATTKGATTITYARDATDRIVSRSDGTTTVKYAYSATGDTGDATLDAAGNVVEATISLPGGVLLTRRPANTAVWSYPNIHGDLIATADQTGVKQGTTMHWGPYGETLTTIPDNSAGAMDYGWLGQHQRPLEHHTGLTPTIEMGARQYDVVLGRFLETDPVEGGCSNDYTYVHGDPVNASDLGGDRSCYSFSDSQSAGGTIVGQAKYYRSDDSITFAWGAFLSEGYRDWGDTGYWQAQLYVNGRPLALSSKSRGSSYLFHGSIGARGNRSINPFHLGRRSARGYYTSGGTKYKLQRGDSIRIEIAGSAYNSRKGLLSWSGYTECKL